MSDALVLPETPEVVIPKSKRVRKCHVSAMGVDGKQYRVTLDPLGWIVVRAHHSKSPMRHPITDVITMMIRWQLGSLELTEEKGTK